MSSTATYVSPDIILTSVLPKVGDKEMKNYSKGLYISIIQQAMEELAFDTFFDEKRESFDFPVNDLTLEMPKGCFNIKGIYLFNGTECNISNSINVYWKRDYFTKGSGYIAHDKGYNGNDPFYGNLDRRIAGDSTVVDIHQLPNVNRAFFYNIQNGNIMFSSSCKAAATKVHIHYSGTGCAIDDIPVIPIFLRKAIEDYTIVQVLLMKIAEEQDARKWQSLLQYYETRLRDPRNGSWQEAEYRVKNMHGAERSNLKTYLSRGAWSQGF
jgi:hypothetical protein